MKVLAPRVAFCALGVPHGLPINKEAVTTIRNLTGAVCCVLMIRSDRLYPGSEWVPRGHITDTLLTETKCGPNKNRCSRTVRKGNVVRS
jgi:hypothetical protein